MEKLEYRLSSEQAGKRLDLLASEIFSITRSQAQNLIEKGVITVNGSTVRSNLRPKAGDKIRMIPVEQEQDLIPEDLPLEVLFQDRHLIVVNKPAGMVVYPAAGHSSGTLMNVIAIRADRLASVGGPLRPGVVHRLDKDTSGVMVIALDDRAYYDLVEQFRERTINRRYRAIIYGNLRQDSGEICLSVGRSESDRKKMSTRSRRGKEAITTWKVTERFGTATLIEAKLGTGRTHQIRVHFAAIGHPVLGDRTYGSKTMIEAGRRKITFQRQMLHAGLLGFTHPITGERLEFSAPMPADMEEKLRDLRSAQDRT